jgi:hypothetical protein
VSCPDISYNWNVPVVEFDIPEGQYISEIISCNWIPGFHYLDDYLLSVSSDGYGLQFKYFGFMAVKKEQ